MKNRPNNIPPADEPDWGGPYNCEWFKFHHFGTLKKYYKLLDKQSKKKPVGKGYKQTEIKIMLARLDEFIALYDWLPDTGGGQDTMKKVMKGRKKFERNYLNKELDDTSYWRAREIIFDVFTIYNYICAICEEE